jgi:ligand-binding sensor domain-containing protein
MLLNSVCRHTIIFFSILFWSSYTFSQTYNYTKYTTEDGLPSNEVYYILEDSKGFLWFATDNGISRFDGYDFKNYSDKDGLIDNLVFSLYEDYKGRIWIISSSLRLAYIKNDIITPYKFNNLLESFNNTKARILNESFYVDTSDNIHIGLYELASIKILNDGEFIIEEQNTAYRIQDLGYSIVSTSNASEFDNLNKTISFEKGNNSVKIKCKWYSSGIFGFKTLTNSLLFTNGKSVYELDNSNNITSKVFKPIAWIGETSDSLIWISCYKEGVKAYKNINQEYVCHFLKGETVTNVFVDSSKNLWISTLEGLFYARSVDIFSETRINGSILKVVKGERNEIWMSGSNGIIYNIVNKNRIYTFPSVGEGFVQAITYDVNNKRLIYGGTSSFGVIKGGIRTPNHKIRLLQRNVDQGFLSNNLLFFSDFPKRTTGVFYYSSINFGYFDSDKWLMNDLYFESPDNRVLYDISLNQDSLVYITSKDGLWKYENDTVIQIKKEDSLLTNNLRASEVDMNGNVWVATKNNGLLYLCNDSVYQIQEIDGLTSNSVNVILPVENTIWVGTMNGLNKISVSNLEKEEYTIEKIQKCHGLVSNVINDLTLIGDTLFVATDGGLSYLNSLEYEFNSMAPPTYISQISIQEKDTLILTAYDLAYNQNNIAIKYVGLNYRQGDKTLYRYRLVGADKNWIETTNRTVRYSSLQPGTYKFEVVASNENGIWGEQPAEVSIIINKPYWRTWWFISLIILASLLLILIVVRIIFRVKLNESKKRNLLHNNLNKLKQEALAQQMNPHFIFNTLSSIQYYINENDTEASNKYLTMFSNLMRMTLNNSHKKNISIKEELDALEMYIQLEQLRFEGRFSYQFVIDPELETAKYQIPSLLLQPFVENSIWHGIMHKKEADGLITVTLTKKGSYIEFIIQDNGVGRKKSSEINKLRRKTHKSLGSKITESRLQLISSLYGDALSIQYTDLEDINENDCGVRVTISLPILADRIGK